MATLSFTQAGFEAFQSVLNVVDPSVGLAFSISATKQLLPATTGTQDIGSATLLINNLYATTVYGTLATAAQGGITSVGTLTGLTSSGAVSVTNATASSSSSTGALIVTGGTGIGGSLYIGTNLNVTGTSTHTGTASFAGVTSVTNATASTTTATGALVVTGGVGVGGALFIGASSTITLNQTASTSLTISNTTVNTAADSRIILTSDAGSGSFIQRSTATVGESGNTVIAVPTLLRAYVAGASRLTLDSSGNLANTGTFTATGGITNTFNLGTTALALNRVSGAVALTGITSIDGDAASVDGKSINAITQWGIVYSDTATSIAGTAAGTANQLIQSNGTAAPTWATFDMATHSPLFPHKMVKWATTADIAPSTFSANVLTGYSSTGTIATTTTAGSLLITVASTATIKVGAAFSSPSNYLPANPVVSSIASATTLTVYNVPGFTLATTAVTGTGTTATATFAAQATAPYSVGSTINVYGVTPTTYNGSFTVTACTNASVSWASAETVTATVQGSMTNLITTAITGTGTTATATFAARTYAPFAVGSTIVVSGTTPSTYSGTFTVTACTTGSVSWASIETVTATVQGYVAFNIAAGSAINHNFSQAIAAFTADSGAATAVGERVLVKDITTLGGIYGGTQYRGIYSITTVGSTSVPWVLTRTADADLVAEMSGNIVTVSTGTINGGKTFIGYTKSTDTLNTSAISYNKFIDQSASSFISTPTTAVGTDIAVDTKTVFLNSGGLADLVSNSLGRVTYGSNAATTYTRASTLYVAGTPIASTNVTITSPYSVYVASGESYFQYGSNVGGAIQAVGYSTSYGLAHTTNRLTGAINVVMGGTGSATWLITGTSSGVMRGGIQLHNDGVAMRFYSTATLGLAVVSSDLQPFSTGTGSIGTTALRFASVNANGADIAGNIKATGATSVVGYGPGSGGTVTQLTSKATGVTNNKGTGTITTAADALAAGAVVSFTFTNSIIASVADSIYVHRQSGGTAGAYNIWVDSVAVGSCVVYIKNVSAGSLSEAIVLNFKVFSGATA